MCLSGIVMFEWNITLYDCPLCVHFDVCAFLIRSWHRYYPISMETLAISFVWMPYKTHTHTLEIHLSVLSEFSSIGRWWQCFFRLSFRFDSFFAIKLDWWLIQCALFHKLAKSMCVCTKAIGPCLYNYNGIEIEMVCPKSQPAKSRFIAINSFFFLHHLVVRFVCSSSTTHLTRADVRISIGNRFACCATIICADFLCAFFLLLLLLIVWWVWANSLVISVVHREQ